MGDKAVGIDVTKEEYGRNLEENLISWWNG